MTVATQVLIPPLSKEAPDSVGVLRSWFVRDGESGTEDQMHGEVQVAR